MRTLVHVAFVTVVAALAIATARAQPTSKACEFLSSADVAAALKRPELEQQRPIGSADPDIPGASECGYGAALYSHHQSTLHKLPNNPPLSIEAFDKDAEARVKSGELTPLPGVGDAAWFYLNQSSKEYGVLVRVGQQLVRLSIPMSLAESETAARAALMSLAQTVAAKLQ